MRNSIRARVGSYSLSSARRIPSGRLWPNGEFTLGYTRDGDESDRPSEWAWTGEGRYLTSNELEQRLEAMHELLDEVEAFYRMSGELACSGLNLSNVWNSHKSVEAKKKGLKGLTGWGSKMLRSACYLLESRLGTEDVVMVTLTVPTLQRAQRIRLAQQWGVLTNRLVQYLTRALVKAGRTPVIAGCVEIQSARLEKYRQGYLHLHLVCPAHSNTGGVWAIDASALRTWWKEAIERVIECPVTSLPRIETAIVEKSVEAYLAKYLSKGSGDDLEKFIADLGEGSVPGQWWFMSAPMRRAVVQGTRSGRNAGVLLDALVQTALSEGNPTQFAYLCPVDCALGGRPTLVGWVGKLPPEMLSDVMAMLSTA